MRIRTFLPMACDGVGPSQTCINIVQGMGKAGADIDLFVNRMRIVSEGLPAKTLLSGPFARIPYPWVSRPLTQVLERWYLRSIKGDEVAYLWPAASLYVHREVHRRSIPIVLEGINTRMKSAKSILDRAYEEFGVEPRHGITEARIQEEEEKLSLATAIYAPNPHVEHALQGLPIASRVINTSYGTHIPRMLPPLAKSQRRDQVVFLFCGYACVRKGIQHLLALWPQMPPTARLRIVGRIEPVIAERFGALLSSDRVEPVGFVSDVAAQYATADVFVFPSLEEGGPQVTYEAAVHGLPILVSPMGAGRMGAAAWVVDPANSDEFLAALIDLHDSRGLREQWGRASQAAVRSYDWSTVGAERLYGLVAVLSGNDGPRGALDS